MIKKAGPGAFGESHSWLVGPRHPSGPQYPVLEDLEEPIRCRQRDNGFDDGIGIFGSAEGRRVLREMHYEVGEVGARSEEHTSELQSRLHLVCRLLLEKKKKKNYKSAGKSPSLLPCALVRTIKPPDRRLTTWKTGGPSLRSPYSRTTNKNAIVRYSVNI